MAADAGSTSRRTLDRQHWTAISAAFERLVDAPPTSWDAELATSFPDQPAIAQRVRQLLAAEELVPPFRRRPTPAESAPASWATTDGAEEEALPRVPGFRCEHVLGSGGMGTVYRAVATTDGEHTCAGAVVALKVLRTDVDREGLARFARERRILERLAHPGIARLLGGGLSEGGQPFLVLELIDGVQIDLHCAERGLSTGERVTLFRQAAGAVEYLHQNLLVHLDLKPQNLLVTDAGVPKLLDFGLARILDPAHADGATTLAGRRWLTPRYASPEQLSGESPTTASDVYSLGVLLYELLTGLSPYGLPRNASGAAYERAAREHEPLRASDAVKGSPRLDRRRALALGKELRGDLDAILAKALRREPEARYASVGELAADLGCWLASQPVAARRTDPGYVARRFIRRHRWVTVAATLTLGGLIGALAITERERGRLLREQQRTTQAFDLLTASLTVSEPRVNAPPPTNADRLRALAATRAALDREPDPLLRAQVLIAIGRLQSGLGATGEARSSMRRAYDLYRRELGLRHPTTLRTLYEVAQAKSDPEPTRRLLTACLAFQREVLPPRSLQLVDTLRLLANLNTTLGAPSAALPYVEEALAIQRASLSASDPSIDDTLEERGFALASLGDITGAEAVYRDVLNRRRATPDVRLASTLTRLASLELNRGPSPAAEAMLEEALAMSRTAWGDDHPFVTGLYNRFLVLRMRDHRYAEARRWGELALAAARHADRPDAAVILLARLNLAVVDRQDRPALAEPELRALVELAERRRDGVTAAIRHELGNLLLETGRPQEAITHLRVASQLSPGVLFDPAVIWRDLVRAYRALGQPELAAQALAEGRRALAAWELSTPASMAILEEESLRPAQASRDDVGGRL